MRGCFSRAQEHGIDTKVCRGSFRWMCLWECVVSLVHKILAGGTFMHVNFLQHMHVSFLEAARVGPQACAHQGLLACAHHGFACAQVELV